MFIKKRDNDSHKGDHGRVLVIGGCEDYIGAPAMAAMAALRVGCDVVIVAAPEKVAWAINNIYPDLITKKFKGEFFNWDNVKDVIEFSDNFDAVLIGNGIGLEPGTVDFVREVCLRIIAPKVIDADALKALTHKEIDNVIYTPHTKECEILINNTLPDGLNEKAKFLQYHITTHKIVYLLKGHVDIIADKENIKFNKTGNPGMTVAGTGDVLAGITAGLLAQSKNLFNSAYYAAYLNGKIGDYLLKKKGIGFTASDMVEMIPEVRKRLKI